jgi:hypothetical protein
MSRGQIAGDIVHLYAGPACANGRPSWRAAARPDPTQGVEMSGESPETPQRPQRGAQTAQGAQIPEQAPQGTRAEDTATREARMGGEGPAMEVAESVS